MTAEQQDAEFVRKVSLGVAAFKITDLRSRRECLSSADYEERMRSIERMLMIGSHAGRCGAGSSATTT